MVKIDKTPLPSGMTIKQESDYRRGFVFNQNHQDCRGKCYICEDSHVTHWHTDHRIPKTVNPDLEFAWENLFLCCPHCNNVKLDDFAGTIDPSKVDPENCIILSLAINDLKEVVVVTKITGGVDVDETIALLNAVYSARMLPHRRVTDNQKLGCTELCNAIGKAMRDFHIKLYLYGREPASEGAEESLATELTRASAFAAFKRHIVRSNAKYARLQKYLEK